MYTTKTPIDMCRFNVRSSTLKNLNIFCKWQISIKLFYLYKRFQGKHLPFSPSPLRLNIFRLLVILSLTQWYRYTPEIFLFSTATFKYTYPAPLRRIGQEYSPNVACSIFQSMKRIQPLPVRSKYGCFESCQFRPRSVFFLSWRLNKSASDFRCLRYYCDNIVIVVDAVDYK